MEEEREENGEGQKEKTDQRNHYKLKLKRNTEKVHPCIRHNKVTLG